MLEQDPQTEAADLQDIDAMARAVYLWVRQQSMQSRFVGNPLSLAQECDLASGFLAGIKSRMGLEDSETTLLAYIYVLMQGDQSAPLTMAQLLANRPAQLVTAAGYEHGLQAAREILGESQAKVTELEPSNLFASFAIN